MSRNSPDIRAERCGPDHIRVLAYSDQRADGRPVDSENYKIGNWQRRNHIAQRLAKNPRICGDDAASTESLEAILLDLEEGIRETRENDGDNERVIERCDYVDDELIAELAWNTDCGRPDFIVHDADTNDIDRKDSIDLPSGRQIKPSDSAFFTPGIGIPGLVHLPTAAEHYEGTDTLAVEITSFIERYVELPNDTACIAVAYVFLTWVYDRFDELPYLAFRTADCGRGKSRAIETVGMLCRRPLTAMGGSTPAATLRLLDEVRGTLVADEFDHKRDSEMAVEITRIINGGFQSNRPIAKCDGDKNEPRAFNCFGPKILALRGELADDASESRTISIRMVQRTRNDIPLNLPREQFDREALHIRNKLLTWRFRNLRTVKLDSSLADPALEDRSNQIGVPLMSVAHDRATQVRIIAALREQEKCVSDRRGDTLPGEVLRVALEIASVGGEVRPGEVAREVNAKRASVDGVEIDKLRNRISAQKVGHILNRALELPRRSKDRNGAVYASTRLE